MGMGMGTRLYPLADGDGIKVWYPLDLSMRMEMNFFTGWIWIAKLVSVPPRRTNWFGLILFIFVHFQMKPKRIVYIFYV